jgi:anti-sigma-K factor RskA
MKPHDQTQHEFGGDAAAYVLGALEADEVSAFRTHLDDCAECRTDVAAFQVVVDALPMAATRFAVPTDLRRRVLDDVLADADAHARKRRRGRGQGPAVRAAVAHALRPPAARLSGALLVTALVAVLALAVVSGGGASGPRLLRAEVTNSGGTAQLRVSDDHASLIVRHFPPPPIGRIYEVWLKRPGAQPAPTTALFSVNATGAADVGVPGAMSGLSEVLVTQEPAGGSLAPTRPPVIRVRLG